MCGAGVWSSLGWSWSMSGRTESACEMRSVCVGALVRRPCGHVGPRCSLSSAEGRENMNGWVVLLTTTSNKTA